MAVTSLSRDARSELECAVSIAIVDRGISWFQAHVRDRDIRRAKHLTDDQLVMIAAAGLSA